VRRNVSKSNVVMIICERKTNSLKLSMRRRTVL
jgi:hypothetical protein